MSEVRPSIAIRALLGLLPAAVALAGCVPGTPPPPVPPAPSEVLELTRHYVAETSGIVKLDGQAAPGGARIDYSVAADGGVQLGDLRAWIVDIDLPVEFAGWPVSSEPLRCGRAVLGEPVAGELSDSGEIAVESGTAELHFGWNTDRKPSGECGGEERSLTVKNPTPMTLEHDPNGDSFALSATFAVDQDGESFVVELSFAGSYVNRPPMAAVAWQPPSIGPAAAELVDGCPASKAAANTPEGLLIHLVSRASDPDGNVKWGEEGDPAEEGDAKYSWPRADVRSEMWMRSRLGEAAFLGHGPSVGPELFALGAEHWFSLDVVDRFGSKSRAVCRFSVVLDEEAS